MRHVPTNLYIDTEIFVNNGLKLDTEGFRSLKDTFVKDGLRLLVPKMMEREFFRHYENKAEEGAKQLEKAHTAYPVSALLLDLPSKNEVEKRCLVEVKQQWETFKEHFIIEELPLVGCLEDIVGWYFEVKPPFSERKKKEFPDAFILSALEQYHHKHKASIAVVTADEDYKNACQSRQYIAYYSDLNEYIKAFEPALKTENLMAEPVEMPPPIVTDDLMALKEILVRGTAVTPIEIQRALTLLGSRDKNCQYFFSNSSNPIWLSHLKDHYFKRPPDAVVLPNGSVQYPFWPEIEYLKNVSTDAPDEVLEIILQIPVVDNPRVYDVILDIALTLDGQRSAQLKPKMLEYARLENQFLAHKYPKLLAHWTSENQTQAALELAAILVQKGHIKEWWYQEILNKGVRPLADKEPYQVARILIDATASMIRLERHQYKIESDTSSDHSELWCPELNKQSKQSSGYLNVKALLVNTLTYACEKVYGQSPESIAGLDGTLRNQQWNVFKRLRQHLYALHPTKQTKPWIRELILAHDDHPKWQYPYEFQQMIRLACEHFGSKLLTEDERIRIFDAILSGPSREYYRERIGEQFTEDDFEKNKTPLSPQATQAVYFGALWGIRDLLSKTRTR